jgi:hypothetical protein
VKEASLLQGKDPHQQAAITQLQPRQPTTSSRALAMIGHPLHHQGSRNVGKGVAWSPNTSSQCRLVSQHSLLAPHACCMPQPEWACRDTFASRSNTAPTLPEASQRLQCPCGAMLGSALNTTSGTCTQEKREN